MCAGLEVLARRWTIGDRVHAIRLPGLPAGKSVQLGSGQQRRQASKQGLAARGLLLDTPPH